MLAFNQWHGRPVWCLEDESGGARVGRVMTSRAQALQNQVSVITVMGRIYKFCVRLVPDH